MDRSESSMQKKSLSEDSLSLFMNSLQNASYSKTQRIAAGVNALNIIKSSGENRGNLEIKSEVAKYLYQLDSDKLAKQTINEVLNNAIQNRDSLNTARAYSVLGNHKLDTGVNDSAYFYFLKAEKLYSKSRDSLELGKNYIEKAFSQLYENDFSGCELSCIQSLNYLRNSDQVQSEYHAFTLIGISSVELKNFDNAIIYQNKALEYVNKYEQISSAKIPYRASTLNNLGYVYQNIGRNNDAILNFSKALKEPNLLSRSPYIYATALDNLAYSKFKKKDYKDLPELFFRALRIRETNQLYSGVVLSKLRLSEYYFNEKDTLTAQVMAQEAMILAKNKKVSGDLLASLQQLSSVDSKNASKYSKEYIQIRDSIQNEERKAKDKFARIAFETDEIISQKDKLAEQNRTLLYFFGGVLVVGLLLFIIRSQRARNRELLLVQAQQKANEEIYSLMISQQANIEESRIREKKRIAQELHDGILGRLFGARLNLDSLNRSNDEEAISSRVNYLNELKNIEQDIREISHDLNREKFALINNFAAILNNLLDEQRSSYEPQLDVYIDNKVVWDEVQNNIKINLYRIVQEALQNINKYAKASQITFSLKLIDEKIFMTIQDDGIGLDLPLKRKGIGLQNMESRIADCNGKFEIQSSKGEGTKLNIEISII